MKINFNLNNLYAKVKNNGQNPIIPIKPVFRGIDTDLYTPNYDYNDKFISRNTSIPREYKKLSKLEYVKYKKEVQKKIAKLEKHRGESIGFNITPYNIFVIDRIISNPKVFYREDFIGRIAPDIVNEVKVQEEQEAKCILTDKIVSCGSLIENYRQIGYFGYNISDCKTIEEAQAKSKVLDEITEFIEEQGKNISLTEYTSEILSQVSDEEGYKKFNYFLNKISSKINEDCSSPLSRHFGSFLSFALGKNENKVADKFLSDEIFYGNNELLNNLHLLTEHLNDYKVYEPAMSVTLDLADEIIKNKNITYLNYTRQYLLDILTSTINEHQLKVAKRIISDKKLCGSQYFMQYAHDIISGSFEEEYADIKIRFLDKITSDPKFYNNDNLMQFFGEMALYLNDKEGEKITDKILSDEKYYNNYNLLLANVMQHYSTQGNGKEILSLLEDKDITPKQIAYCFDIEPDLIKKLNRTIGIKEAQKLDFSETSIATRVIELYGIKEICDIPIKERRNILKTLIDWNSQSFSYTNTLKRLFPLVPTNQQEYCDTISNLVKLINVSPNKLNETDIKDFYVTLDRLSDTLSKLSDEEFKNLEIKQNYSKNDFIKDILEELRTLDDKQKREIFNYFNFEICANRQSLTGYSIEGYPSIPNYKKPYPTAKVQAENIEKLILKFNKDNTVQTNNPEISEFLNKILNIFPELRLTIGKIQSGNVVNGYKIGHGSHDYDVFKHSLKVMQKISQDKKFNKHSNKNILLLASLFHDISKGEGYVDKNHAEVGSFDTYFITKKLGLSKQSEYKLYTLIKNHEWLSHINKFKDDEDLNQRLKSVAYELRYDDMVDLSLFFTHADLKAVRASDAFHDSLEGSSRKVINGKKRSFGESADIYAKQLKKLVRELQETQPVLPTTKFPSASRINKAITKVNPDGSTDIKGVYKDEDGLIIIKFNEVEDWEKIGFSKGTISRGINFKTPSGEDVDTGNIKFFAHGLDYMEQLANFDALSLIDSDAVLSVSYAERPESKYRFFRPQGVILETRNQNILGGGNSDAGSGTKKSTEDFKKGYIFEGYRKQEREFIPKLIKSNIYCPNYTNFVKTNENKEMSEIIPQNTQIGLIKTLGSINSNKRRGERNYNEFYITNPNVIAVYAYGYSNSEKIENPIEFLNRKYEFKERENLDQVEAHISTKARTGFLRKYALTHDVPFVIFGE